jgi:hypothetical protein
MAGFGGGANKSKSKKVKETKLKLKQQWDWYMDLKTYSDLKTDSKIRVTIQVLEDKEASREWLKGGGVKSKGNEYTAIAVARQ